MAERTNKSRRAAVKSTGAKAAAKPAAEKAAAGQEMSVAENTNKVYHITEELPVYLL